MNFDNRQAFDQTAVAEFLCKRVDEPAADPLTALAVVVLDVLA